MSMSEASASGQTLGQLVELRSILATAIDECDSKRDLAALTRRYMDVLEAIDRREGGSESDDEIAAIIIRNRQSAAD